jgi:hypothetical protein
MSSHPLSAMRSIGRVGFLAILVLVLTACTSAASPEPKSAATPTSGASSVPAGAVTAALPNAETTTSVATSGVAVGAGGVAVGVTGGGIAYPYPIYGGTPGAAPDHSILVTGSGQASVKADGSDAASAEKTALGKALVEARRRADEIATATGVTITGVLSVSETVGQGWVASVGTEAPGAAPVPPSNGTEPAPVPPVPSAPDVEVTVTVAYSIGS